MLHLLLHSWLPELFANVGKAGDSRDLTEILKEKAFLLYPSSQTFYRPKSFPDLFFSNLWTEVVQASHLMYLHY